MTRAVDEPDDDGPEKPDDGPDTGPDTGPDAGPDAEVETRRLLAERDARIAELEGEIEAQRRREQQRIAELRTLHERRLRQVRESIAYRVGDEVVRAARSPRRLARLPGVLVQLYRQRRVVAATAGVDLSELPEPSRATRAAAVLDEFTMRCFAPELRIVPITRTGWPTELRERPDLLLVESAWEGNGGEWRYALSGWAGQQPNELQAAIAWCREQGVPTVFWNKEDPVNFEVFLDAARHFDVVFTTDADAIPWYRDALGHDRVGVLPFAAQPLIHNPMGNRSNGLDRVCFAGSWRGEKYEQRAQEAGRLLQPALDLGVLDIFDRQAGTADAFPPPYDRAVQGARSYDETVAAYRRYAAFLNVNSVSASPTMFSRRVFEILACATPVISTPARGITELLGDAVIVTDTADDTRRAVERVVHDHDYRDQVGQRGYRHVMAHHTYSHRIDTLLDFARVSPLQHREPLVSVLCSSMRPERAEAVFEAFARQTYAARELIFVTNAAGFDTDLLHRLASRVANTKILHVDPAATLGECLNAALDVSSGRYVAKWDDDDTYGPEYLRDALLAFRYADAAVVGKTTFYAYMESTDATVLREPGREFSYVNRVAGGTIVADRDQVGSIRFASLPRGTDTRFLQDCREAGLRIFSADRFNYLLYRQAERHQHTWAVTDRDFEKDAVRVASGVALDRVIV
ncbi:MAG: hypothetical protein JWL83_3896 [Actinomycetia bacterium]|nr:hypothetical protein [Actinomycetes bacterium]